MSSINVTGITTTILASVSIGSILFGATWFALVSGIIGIFAAIWWVGDMEKEGRFS